jgi:hypothetical protein
MALYFDGAPDPDHTLIFIVVLMRKQCQTMFRKFQPHCFAEIYTVLAWVGRDPHCKQKQYRKFETNIPRKGIVRPPSPNFHIHVSVSDLYIPRVGSATLTDT